MAGSILLKKAHLGGWIKNQPLWARDALRRLALGEFDKNDREEILINLKTHNKISIDKKTICKDFTEDHFKTEPPDATPRTLLCSIGPSKHVNRLADDQIMKFALDGLTLIYGHNGSGKSGYCRIIKKLCRSFAEEDILDNAFKDGEVQKPQATVTYKSDDGEEITENWIDETDPPESLSGLKVFDDKCATRYVNKDNKIGYSLPEIDFLKGYTGLLDDLKEILTEEFVEVKKTLQAPYPCNFIEGTDIFKLIELFKSSTPINQLPAEQKLINFAVWNDADDKEIVALEKQIAEDPAKKLSDCKILKATLTNLYEQINAIELALDTPKINELEQVFNLAETTARTAQITASKYFEDELPCTGFDPWRRMYEHATKYATSIGAPNNKIYSEINDPCLLCQQPLDEEASKRLKKFEAFVSKETSKDAERARDDLKEKTDAIGKISIPHKKEYEPLLQQYATLNEDIKIIVRRIETFFTEAAQVLTVLKNCIENNKFIPPETSITAISLKLNEYMIALEADIKILEQKSNDDQRSVNLKQQLNEQLNELYDREKFSHTIEFFTKRLKDLNLLAKLNKSLGDMDTTNASKEISRLRKELLAKKMEEGIREEIKALNLTHIPFIIKNKTDHGDTLIGVNLKDTPHKNHEILSEGEQRALALACFLAEVKRDPIKHGIIFDDPASSFDHIRTEQIAHRLVAEAKDRQVIIFTHDILFYNEVIKFAKENQTSPVEHYIEKTVTQGFGVISSIGMPWDNAPVDKRIARLDSLADTIMVRFYDNEESRRRDINSFYSDLRKTWERLVEKTLLNKVISRYEPDVRTKNLTGVVVKSEDYQTIDRAMTKASKYSHDRPDGGVPVLPKNEEIKNDVEEIRKFYEEIKDRRKDCLK